MRTIYFTIIFLTVMFGQDTARSETFSQPESPLDTVIQSVPSGLEMGYKSFSWGSLKGAAITTSFTPMTNSDSVSSNQSFVGSLGPDSVTVTYFFADSGFWKAEINFVIKIILLFSNPKNFDVKIILIVAGIIPNPII